jgi:LmbE family N-acetylglucosaminyl deacetylase
MFAAALSGHRTEVLVGSYWRVLPLKLAAHNHQTVLPLASCTVPRTVLTSSTWQPDLHHHSFAYLLSLDSADHDFTGCTLEKVTAVYGRPNASTIIAGTNDKPQEVILFYDQGIGPARVYSANAQLQTASPVHAVSPTSLKHTTCGGHRTILQVVAHEDDDLLFMNPDLLHSIQQGDCVRTVYITAGDAGISKFYWLGREQGSEAAYGVLAHTTNLWVEQTLKFASQEFATVASPVKSSRFSLIFMHLPDGSPSGQGFAASGFESLEKLNAGSVATIHSVDHQSSYDYRTLLSAITTLVEVYQPDELRTQLPYSANMTYVDHSDHMTVGRLATQAYQAYLAAHPDAALTYYIGYPVHTYEPNVSGSDLSLKQRAFFAYSHFDGAACGSPERCAKTGVYEAYLSRQYRVDAAVAE